MTSVLNSAVIFSTFRDALDGAGARLAALLVVLLVAQSVAAAPQSRTLLRGQVTDETGAAIVAARVTLVDSSGRSREAETDRQGRFAIRDAAAGTYTLRVEAEGFSEYVDEALALGGGPAEPLKIVLSIAVVAESVTVSTDAGVSSEPDQNASAIVLTGRDIETLPDDPDELASVLQEMAGPGAGPGGGQFYIDGLQGGRLPPKESIREIRINSNPFAAEYDRLGFGRIEILTKPGSDKFRGSAFFNFNDEALNARNPLAPFRAPHQERNYGSNVSGPLGKRASYFFDFERREADDSQTVTATILDASFNPIAFADSIVAPRRRLSISPRLDYQLDDDNTLVFRYQFADDTRENQGVGGFSLPSRAFSTTERDHEIAATWTSILSPKLLSETRFQYERERRTTTAAEPGIAISVLDAFNAGASDGAQRTGIDEIEIHQLFSFTSGTHTVKAGARIRGIRLSSESTANFLGTFTFAGDFERDPETGALVPGDDGAPLPITSLEQYRRVLLGLPGYRPSQFSIAGGNPEASVTRWDVGLFAQDDWRVRPNFTLSYGLRYEGQNRSGDALSLAPRVGFAYAFNGEDGRPTTVIRAGAGVFFERVGESLALDAERFDGEGTVQYVVRNPDFFGVVPSTDELLASAVPQTLRLLETTGKTPYTIEAAAGVERQLPGGLTASANFIWARGLHQLRTRNLNAPINGVRPLGDETGNVYIYEASGLSERRQLRIGLNKRGGGPYSIFANYSLGWARSDTDGAWSLPSNPLDLSQDWGRSGDDVRHGLFVGGSVDLPWKVRLNPMLIARSGRPYNITAGRDLNFDTAFTDRPAFATPGEAGAVLTSIGWLDPTPEPGDVVIPRNAAEGPSFVVVSLGAQRTFSFGQRSRPEIAGGGTQAQPGGFGGIAGRGGPGGHGGGRGGHGGHGGFGAGGDGRLNLTVGVRAWNLLNHANYGAPSGVLTSPTFGRFNIAMPGRRIEAQLRVSF